MMIKKKKRNHAAGKPPRLRHVLETHAAGLDHRYDRLPCLGLSCCLSAGHVAPADLKPADDLRSYAVLDIAFGADRGLDDYATTAGGIERFACWFGDYQR